MAKSLEAGYETDMTKLKDGGALRKESLEGSNHSNSNKEKKKMEKLGKNRDEVFTHFSKSCKSKKEAEEKTEEYMKALAEERETEKGEKGEFKKSLSSGIDAIMKSVTSLRDIVPFIEKGQTEVVKVDADMKKSIATLRETPDQFSGEQFLGLNTQAYLAATTNQNEAISKMAKSIANGFEGIANSLALMKSIHEATLDAVEQASDVNDLYRENIRNVKKSLQGFTRSTDALQPLNGGEAVSDEQILKLINVIPVKEFLVNRQVSVQDSNPTLAQEYSNAYMLLDERKNFGFGQMNKSIVAEVIAWARPQLPAPKE